MSENKTIVKNSIFLYTKLVFSTILGLYSSRVVLLELGQDSFGLFMVVGGLISLISFLSSTMITTTYRFISVELGKGNLLEVNRVFNKSLVIHLIVAIILVLFGYFIGNWYVTNKLIVTEGQLDNAIFVLYFTLLSTAISVVSIPYQGLITAMENFKVLAFIEILNTLIRFMLVIMLTFMSGDKLRIYTIMVTFLSFLMVFQYMLYCYRNYSNYVRWKFVKSISEYKSIFSFAGWIMIGALSSIGVNQGGALVINLFFGTSINAAYGISRQVFGYVMTIVKSINDAAAPQIMKSSANNAERSLNIVYKMSKYSFLIMLIPSYAFIINMDAVLLIWLTEVPAYSAEFTNLLLINGLIGVLGSGFSSAIQATGRIKQHQIMYSIIVLIPLPLAYMAFEQGYEPYYISVLMIISQIFVTAMQIFFMKLLTNFTLRKYYFETLKPIFWVCLALIPVQILFTSKIVETHFLINFLLVSLLTLVLCFYLGLNHTERSTIRSFALSVYQEKLKKK